MNLYDAIDKDHFIIDDIQYTDTDLQNMSVEELETLKMRISKKISGISSAIRLNHAGNDKRAKDWRAKCRLALSINQRVLTYVSALIKQRLRKSRSISDFFMQEAKTILPRNEFERVLDKAHKEMDKGGL